MGSRPLHASLLLLLLLPLAPFRSDAQSEAPAGAPAPAVAERVQEILTLAERDDLDRIWRRASEIEAFQQEAIAPLQRAVPNVHPRAKLVCAKALANLGRREEAVNIALDLVGHQSAVDLAIRRMATELLLLHARKREVAPLVDSIDSIAEPLLQVAVAKVVRTVAKDLRGVRVLKELLESADPDVRNEAALALAEMENVAAAKQILGDLRMEPTERGRLARVYLEREQIMEQLEFTGGLAKDPYVKKLQEEIEVLRKKVEDIEKKGEAGDGDAGEWRLLAELKKNIKTFYVDENLTDDKALVDAAARGMVGALDPFSSYMDEKETKGFHESIQGRYAGIGAVVSIDPKDRILTIIRPIYSGPAYRAGLRSLDKITEVEGESTRGKTVEEIVSKLKGAPGTEVQLKVYRKGWRAERSFSIQREEIALHTVHHRMLPGRIGYLALAQFGEHASEEVEAALVEMEGEGMRGLIFDLRSNPGGLLNAAVEIADMFLRDDKLIVYSEGRNQWIAPRREFRTKDASTRPPYPIVLLINGASASASEIVSGALQKHGRAVLLGETSFGKGSVQQILKVQSTNGASSLRLTIAKYYLPDGTSIHQVGVKPDLAIAPPEESACRIEEFDRIRTSQAVDRYVEKLRETHQEHFPAWAEFDGRDPSIYPDFESFYASLETEILQPDDIRRLVRAGVRRRVQDDRGAEFACDVEEDIQLRAAVTQVLKRIDDDARAYPEYQWFADDFNDLKPPEDKNPGSAHPGRQGGPNEEEPERQ